MRGKIEARGEAANILVGGLLAILIGAGTATAAFSVGFDGNSNIAARPLSFKQGIRVAPVHGPEDEDCVHVIRQAIGRNGEARQVRKLVCVE